MARVDNMLVTNEDDYVGGKNDILVNEYPDLTAAVNNIVGVSRLLSCERRGRVGRGDRYMGKISTGANALEPKPRAYGEFHLFPPRYPSVRRLSFA